MGNIPSSRSYNLHTACPELKAKYDHCYALFFENRLIAAETSSTSNNASSSSSAADSYSSSSSAQASSSSSRPIYRNGVVVTDPADVALALQSLDSSHPNYACRDMWEDYKDCVMDVLRQKQEDYLRRKAEKEHAKAAASAPSTSTATSSSPSPSEVQHESR